MPAHLRTDRPAHGANRLAAFGYVRARLSWSRTALASLARRWAVYLGMALVASGAFSVGAWDSLRALAAWTVLPLAQAAAGSLGAAAAATLAHSMVGVGIVIALRPVLLPLHWAEIEAALPLGNGPVRVADTLLCAAALGLLWAVYGAGCAVWLTRDPAWLQGHEGRAAELVLCSAFLSLAAGMAVLQAARATVRRHASGARGTMRRLAPAARSGPDRWPARPAWQVLWWWPLWRGPARRLGRLSTFALLALPGWALALALWPAGAGWWLSGFAASALGVSSGLSALAREELAALVAACEPLPLDGRRLQRLALGATLLPAAAGLLALGGALGAGGLPVRPAVAALFAAACAGGLAWQVFSAPGGDPQARAAGWLLTLVGLIALASEVVP